MTHASNHISNKYNQLQYFNSDKRPPADLRVKFTDKKQLPAVARHFPTCYQAATLVGCIGRRYMEASLECVAGN